MEDGKHAHPTINFGKRVGAWGLIVYVYDGVGPRIFAQNVELNSEYQRGLLKPLTRENNEMGRRSFRRTITAKTSSHLSIINT